MAEPFIGEVKIFAGNFAPRGWAFCEGQLISIQQNTALFSLLGTTYGGDGRTTFGLPDLRGRVPMGMGRGPGLSDRREGQKLGEENVTLTTHNLPSHTHASELNVTSTLQISTADATTNVPASNTFLSKSVGLYGRDAIESNIYSTTSDSTMDSVATTGNVTIQNTGESIAHDNMQPSLVMNYIIALVGIFPSRS